MSFHNFFKKIQSKGSFANELGISIGGGTISYLIGFLFTPIISRIYLPSEYGIFALLTSFSINLSLFASLGFSGAILMPKSTRELSWLLKTIFLLLILFTIIFYTVLFAGKESILAFFNATGLQDYWYLIPIMVLILHVTNVAQSLCVRLGAFKRDAMAKISSIIVGKSTVLLYAILLSPTFLGLAFGEIVLRLTQIMHLISSKQVSSSIAFSFLSIKKSEIARTFKEYKSYPLYFMPANWLNIMVVQLPLYFIAANYHEETVGYFSFSVSILNLPLMVVGYSFSQVLFRKLLALYEEGHSLIFFSRKIFLILVLVGVLPFGLLFFFGEEIYVILLGEKWAVSGVFAEVLSPYFLIQFIVYPFLSVFRVFRIERSLMITNFLMLIVLFFGLLYAVGIDEIDFVQKFSIIGSLLQVSVAVFIYYTLKKM